MIKPEEMKRLEADMASDKELNEKFYRTVDRIASEGKVQNDAELFAKAATELGYNITTADFERLDADDEEIDPDELEMSAGGDGNPNHKMCLKDYWCGTLYDTKHRDENNHNEFCMAAWHCFTAMLHSETENKDMACWSDYTCVVVSHTK